MEQVVTSLFVLAILLLLLVRWKLRRRRISAADKKRILALWEQVLLFLVPEFVI